MSRLYILCKQAGNSKNKQALDAAAGSVKTSREEIYKIKKYVPKHFNTEI